MNTQALNQLYHQAMAMLDQALATIHELKTLETATSGKILSEEEMKKRRRLKAIRWSIMLGISYGGYAFVRRWLKKRRDYKKFQSLNSNSNMNMNRNMNLNGGRSAAALGQHPNYQHQHHYPNGGGYSNTSYAGGDNYYSGSSGYRSNIGYPSNSSSLNYQGYHESPSYMHSAGSPYGTSGYY